MKNILLTTLILLVSAISLVAQSNKDTAAIRKIMDDQDAAWNRGDLEAFMSIGYWKSDKLKFVSGDKITYGWQQTLDNYKKTYGTPDKMGKLTFSNLEIELLSKDAAFVTGSWHLKREKDAPQGKFTLLFRKLKEGWRIVVDHSS
ncbi:MAG: nuclear transport factor 2 family protein [Pyrinomonadaceae bacterium]|nr:nuclear transport factor 2 family protein [Acidobacteriota bacterium]MBP7476040.1 nuclear transport factor 2 family protein [Pyrinomonadaceae bacterium]MBP9109720.1 nuclear transport factor 2 family protein [Pyrinomonadaceae bacterium]